MKNIFLMLMLMLILISQCTTKKGSSPHFKDSQLEGSENLDSTQAGLQGGGSCKLNSKFGTCTIYPSFITGATQTISIALVGQFTDCKNFTLRATFYEGITCSGYEEDIMFTKIQEGTFEKVEDHDDISIIKMNLQSYKMTVGTHFSNILYKEATPDRMKSMLSSQCENHNALNDLPDGSKKTLSVAECNGTNAPSVLYDLVKVTTHSVFSSVSDACPQIEYTNDDGDIVSKNLCTHATDFKNYNLDAGYSRF